MICALFARIILISRGNVDGQNIELQCDVNRACGYRRRKNVRRSHIK
jgi:hypothetical protein